MVKTIKVGGKEITIDNNAGWAMVYKDQFGEDILPVIMPAIVGGVDMLAGFIRNLKDKKEITIEDLAEFADDDTLFNAALHLGGLGIVDVECIIWALAKNADDSIPEPKKWIRQFDIFPLDVIVPEVVKLVCKGMVSSKNLKRVNDWMKTVHVHPIKKEA